MKSSNVHINPAPIQDLDGLRSAMKKEKEALVSMFLANASLLQLSDQYKKIDELQARIRPQGSDASKK